MDVPDIRGHTPSNNKHSFGRYRHNPCRVNVAHYSSNSMGAGKRGKRDQKMILGYKCWRFKDVEM